VRLNLVLAPAPQTPPDGPAQSEEEDEPDEEVEVESREALLISGAASPEEQWEWLDDDDFFSGEELPGLDDEDAVIWE
jgi:hypothetical protein